MKVRPAALRHCAFWVLKMPLDFFWEPSDYKWAPFHTCCNGVNTRPKDITASLFVPGITLCSFWLLLYGGNDYLYFQECLWNWQASFKNKPVHSCVLDKPSEKLFCKNAHLICVCVSWINIHMAFLSSNALISSCPHFSWSWWTKFAVTASNVLHALSDQCTPFFFLIFSIKFSLVL